MSWPSVRDLAVVKGGRVGASLWRGVRRNGISKTGLGVSWGGRSVGSF